MVFKLRHRQPYEHVRVTVFVGEDADHLQNCGTLAMRPREWLVFSRMLYTAPPVIGLSEGDVLTEVLLEEEKS